MTGTHQNGKNDADLKLFALYIKTELNIFPKNLEKKFPNLENLTIQNTQISSISKYDLQPFGYKLKNIYFHTNKLEVIEGDIFEFTSNLEVIYLDGNQFKHVGTGTFDQLQKLSTLHFNGNPCHSGSASDRPSVISLTATIITKCTDIQALEKYQKLKPRITELKIEENEQKFDKIKAENDRLIAEIGSLNEDILKKDRDVDAGKVKITELEKTIEKLLLNIEEKDARISTLEAEVAVVNKPCDDANNKFQEIIKKFSNLDAKIDTMKDSMDIKLENLGSSINMEEKFSSINATCFSLDYKLDILKEDCTSSPFFRKP